MRKQILGIVVVALAGFGFALGRFSLSPTSHPETSFSHPAVADSVLPVDQGPTDELSSPLKRIAGVRLERVQHRPGARSLHARGRVETNDGRIYRVFTGSDGRLSTLENNSPGTVVRKGEKLATFFSNDLVKAEQAYFFSLQTLERVKASNRPADLRQAQDGVRASEEALLSLGMGEPQIHELAKTREATRDIEVVSPADGLVVARNLFQQQRLERGSEIYRIIDMSRIWIFASVLPGEMPVLRPGTKATVKVPNGGKSLEAVVSSAVPLVDSDRRTLQLKLEAQNPGLILRPDMYVDIEFQIPDMAGISVPTDAVIDGGIETIVYVATADNTFEPRVVELGSKFGDRVLVRHGLSEGDRVVVSGHFLGDSESRARRESLRVVATELH
jgi:Cu(I)/Ag(I) efflux system membrane fusion protein